MLSQKVTEYKGGGGGGSYSIPISHNDFYLHCHVQSSSGVQTVALLHGNRNISLLRSESPFCCTSAGTKMYVALFPPSKRFHGILLWHNITFVFLCHRILLPGDRKFCGMHRVITVRTNCYSRPSLIHAYSLHLLSSRSHDDSLCE
jgi:hypothetical protein